MSSKGLRRGQNDVLVGFAERNRGYDLVLDAFLGKSMIDCVSDLERVDWCLEGSRQNQLS